MKQQLKGKQFQGVDDARAFFEGVIFDTPQSTWSGAVVTWFERMTKCLHAEGGYHEELDLARNLYIAPRSPHPETYGVPLV